MRSQVAIHRTTRLRRDSKPDLGHALRLVPGYERAVREVSRMFDDASIRHALVGALGANAYRDRPRTTADIDFLVGDEAFETHAGGFVTMRVPVVEFDGIDIDQVPLTEALRVIEEGLERAARSGGVPIAPVDTIVIMKLLAGRAQDLADVEAIVESGIDREALKDAVRQAAPDLERRLDRVYRNVDERR